MSFTKWRPFCHGQNVVNKLNRCLKILLFKDLELQKSGKSPHLELYLLCHSSIGRTMKPDMFLLFWGVMVLTITSASYASARRSRYICSLPADDELNCDQGANFLATEERVTYVMDDSHFIPNATISWIVKPSPDNSDQVSCECTGQ